jgi:hypothetical protein
MADNVAVTPGSGATFAADDISNVLYPRVKIAIGPDGSATDWPVNSGNVGATIPRVTLATDDLAIASVVTAIQNAASPTVNPTPTTSGGLDVFRSLDIDESVDANQQVKGSAGQLYKLRITNNSTSVRYLKLYNLAHASVTVGTSTVMDTIVLPPAASAGTPTVLTEAFGGMGLAFSTALTLAATTGLADNDTGAPGANDVVVTAYYK